jgi:alpha-D-ribose 1-methylphosphonate 5-triphosphate synthase subunit PhnG
MTKLTPQQLADVWYLRFGYSWVNSTNVEDATWKKIIDALMRNSLLDYHLVQDRTGINEVYKLRENHANR